MIGWQNSLNIFWRGKFGKDWNMKKGLFNMVHLCILALLGGFWI
jgi:hypothetical protein